jgi:hypothetical protein
MALKLNAWLINLQMWLKQIFSLNKPVIKNKK